MFRRKTSDTSDDIKLPTEPDPNGEAATGLEDFPRKRGAERSVQFHPDVPNRAPGQRIQTERPAAERTPIERPAASEPARAARPEGEQRRLAVGKDISLTGGEISQCDRLVVEGAVEGTSVDAHALEIARGGRVNGSAVVDSADIGGSFEGELTVRNRLTIQASGEVKGQVRYGQLEVERGGRLIGTLEHSEQRRDADIKPVNIANEIRNAEAAGSVPRASEIAAGAGQSEASAAQSAPETD